MINRGYFGMPEATADCVAQRVVPHRRRVPVDDDGNYYFVDRIKDAIRRRGENISSFEVEALVYQHADVVESAAVAVPSEYTEDEVKVCVVLRDGAEVTHEELIEFLVERRCRSSWCRATWSSWTRCPKTEATLRTQKFEAARRRR